MFRWNGTQCFFTDSLCRETDVINVKLNSHISPHETFCDYPYNTRTKKKDPARHRLTSTEPYTPFSLAATIYVIAVPKEGERFTEFFILGENRTATDYLIG